MKKALVSILLTTVISFSLTACNSQVSPQVNAVNTTPIFENEVGASRPIRLGFEGGLCQAAIPLTHLNGFFAEEGLETEIVVTGDLVTSRDSLAAGHIDTVAGMLAAWFVPATQGMDLRFTQGLHTGCASAFVLADSEISEFEAGQNIAVSGAIGGAFHNIGMRFIHRSGLSPEDFTWRDFPAAEAVLALQNGDVQVAVIPEQVGKAFVEQGILRTIRSLDDEDFAKENCCVLGVMGDFQEDNPETVSRLNRAIERTSLWLNESDENKREGITTLIEAGYLSAGLDIDYVVSLMSHWQWGVSNEMTEQTLTTSIQEYQEIGVINPSLDPEAVRRQLWSPQ